MTFTTRTLAAKVAAAELALNEAPVASAGPDDAADRPRSTADAKLKNLLRLGGATVFIINCNSPCSHDAGKPK